MCSDQRPARQHLRGLGTASCHKLCQTVKLPVTYHSYHLPHCLSCQQSRWDRSHSDWRNHWKKKLLVFFSLYTSVSAAVLQIQRNTFPILLAENTYCFPKKYKQVCFSATKKPKFKFYFCISKVGVSLEHHPKHLPISEAGTHQWHSNFKKFRRAKVGKQKSTLNITFLTLL